MIRLDLLVAACSGISRAAAKGLILAGKVSVDGSVCMKPGMKCDANSGILVDDSGERYVSRGGVKLARALEVFGICLAGRNCLDVGASTGGFTDCMLQNGAKLVVAVENGSGQMNEQIKADERVISLENTDIRTAKIECRFDFVACDVSFISITKVITAVADFLIEDGEAVMLIKPQFEVGPGIVSKRGIVKDKKIHVSVICSVLESIAAAGMTAAGLDFSPITGGDGNIEYLLYATKTLRSIVEIDAQSVVKSAFEELL